MKNQEFECENFFQEYFFIVCIVPPFVIKLNHTFLRLDASSFTIEIVSF